MNTEFEYMNQISLILEQTYEKNKDNIKIVAEKMAETVGKIWIVPIEAVEDFVLTVGLTDSLDVVVSE